MENVSELLYFLIDDKYNEQQNLLMNKFKKYNLIMRNCDITNTYKATDITLKNVNRWSISINHYYHLSM